MSHHRESSQNNKRYNSPPSFRSNSPYNTYFANENTFMSNQRSRDRQRYRDHSETKLSQKIYKLKEALKDSQKSNKDLQDKAKYYKDLYLQEMPVLRDQVKKYKKKYGAIQVQHQRKIQEYQDLKVKHDSEQKQIMVSNNEKNYLIKDMQSKIVELQAKISELNSQLHTKAQSIKLLQTSSLTQKQHIQTLQSQMLLKQKQCQQQSKKILNLQSQLKQLLKKQQKSNTTIYDQAQRQKELLQQLKGNRNMLQLAQKQSNHLKDKIQNSRVQGIEKVSKLQKIILEHEFQKKRLTQKLSQQIKKNQKQQYQLQDLLNTYNTLHQNHIQIVEHQYEIHKDMERELSLVAKEIARRHMVCKASSKGSTTASVYSRSQSKKQLPHFQHFPHD